MSITDYFLFEKLSGLWLIFLGLSSIIFLLLTQTALQSSQLLKGSSHSTVIFGILVLIIGSIIYFRTDQQLSTLLSLFNQDLNTLVTQESERITAVLNGFSIYKLITLTSIIIGVILSYRVSGCDYYLGIAIGLIGLPAIILLTDIILERNAQLYLKYLGTL